MDQTPSGVEPERQAPSEPGDSESADAKHWSPFSTTQAKWSWILLTIFVAIYFVVAILTSEVAAELAATMIFGLPLGFILGVGMIIAGLVITRIYLAKVEN